jgi:hypothetical protein
MRSSRIGHSGRGVDVDDDISSSPFEEEEEEEWESDKDCDEEHAQRKKPRAFPRQRTTGGRKIPRNEPAPARRTRIMPRRSRRQDEAVPVQSESATVRYCRRTKTSSKRKILM